MNWAFSSSHRAEVSASHLMEVYLLQQHDPHTREQQEMSGLEVICSSTHFHGLALCMQLGLDLHRQVPVLILGETQYCACTI